MHQSPNEEPSVVLKIFVHVTDTVTNMTYGIVGVSAALYGLFLIWLWRRPIGRQRVAAAIVLTALVFVTYAALGLGPHLVCGNDPICLKEGLAGPLYLILVAPIQLAVALVLSHFRSAKRRARWRE